MGYATGLVGHMLPAQQGRCLLLAGPPSGSSLHTQDSRAVTGTLPPGLLSAWKQPTHSWDSRDSHWSLSWPVCDPQARCLTPTCGSPSGSGGPCNPRTEGSPWHPLVVPYSSSGLRALVNRDSEQPTPGSQISFLLGTD